MITINNLYFSYTGKSPYTLENLSFELKKGNYISILGCNGCGKSTLIKLILGFITPISGNLNICVKNIGYVPQLLESFNREFPITVYEILNCHRKVLKIKDSSIIDTVLKKVNMTNFKNSLVGNLSGGERQKIFIARALIGNPSLLILDEPSTGIDIKSQHKIYKLLKKLNVEDNITILAVEHNLSAALSNSTHIFNMKNGSGILYSKNSYIELKKGEVI